MSVNLVGTVLRDRYELIAKLGQGGMSMVYLAKDRNLGSYWAVKQMSNETSTYYSTFRKEVELLATLNHPDIPRIVERFEYNKDYFVIMDFIDGIPLGKKVLTEGPQHEDEVIEWAKMLCDILHYLHTAKGIPVIYRDMKPDNIMLSQGGRVKLIDFGIAKECRAGERQIGANIGTKGYAAPEQYKDGSNILDERTDIYSLGATLFYLLTGIIPGKPPDAIRPIRQWFPLISEGLEHIILKSTNDNPTHRYQNSQEFKQDLINIEQLTSSYRKKMIKKLYSFIFCCISFLFSLILTSIGYEGIQNEKEDSYQYYYKLATTAESNENYSEAINYYTKAINYKKSSIETYYLYFNALLPQIGEEDYENKTKDAISTIRNTYLENKKSAMYHNSELSFQVAKKCLEVKDASYAKYALTYMEMLKENDYLVKGLESYLVIASYCSQNTLTQDFNVFNKELIALEELADKDTTVSTDKLEYYYTIIIMYTSYPTYLENSYQKISQIGSKAKKVIDANMDSQEFEFTNIIPMYEMVASAIYNYAVTLNEENQKNEQYQVSIEWFGYLEDLNDNLNERLWIKKANAYYEIHQITNNKTLSTGSYHDFETTYLNQSIQEYIDIINTFPTSFQAHISITQAYLELSKCASGQNLSIVETYYSKVIQLKENNKNLSNIDLAKFASLKKEIINAGLEEPNE